MPSSEFANIVEVAQEILSKRYERPVRIVDAQRISAEDRRNLLLRLTIEKEEREDSDRQQQLPHRLIVKRVVPRHIEQGSDAKEDAEDECYYNPDDLESFDTQRFFGDWVGAQLLSDLCSSNRDGQYHGPLFYGGHLRLGFILLEDLGSEQDHSSLVEPLLEDDNSKQAEVVLMKYAARLGQMHADTLGKLDEFRRLQDALHPGLAAHQANKSQQFRVERIFEDLESLGCQVSMDAKEEIRVIEGTVANPGPFTAYVHHDVCPDNVLLLDNGELRVMDFEFGKMGHALIDILYARMIFPTCWCCNRLPKELIIKMEELYRHHLAQTCTVGCDDARFYEELTKVCGYWTIKMIPQIQHALNEDAEWGIATMRPRILSRLDAFIDASTDFGHLPALRRLMVEVQTCLQEKWPDAERLPLYPAFRKNK